VGQHAPAILAIAHPVRDGLDWREPFYLAPDSDLRCGLADASNCMVHPTEEIIKADPVHSTLAQALGRDFKGKISPLLYLAGIGMAFVNPWISNAIYVLVALIWLVPDRRIENVTKH
jgi:hypothetical protein